MKKVIYSIDEIQKAIRAINEIKVVGFEQAKLLVIFQQVIDNPLEIIESEEKCNGNSDKKKTSTEHGQQPSE